MSAIARQLSFNSHINHIDFRVLDSMYSDYRAGQILIPASRQAHAEQPIVTPLFPKFDSGASQPGSGFD
jgi:hypothetical protein